MIDRAKAALGIGAKKPALTTAPEVVTIESEAPSAPYRGGFGKRLSVYADPDSPVPAPKDALLQKLVCWSADPIPYPIVQLDCDGHEVDIVLTNDGIAYIHRPTLEEHRQIREAPDTIGHGGRGRFVPWAQISKVEVTP